MRGEGKGEQRRRERDAKEPARGEREEPSVAMAGGLQEHGRQSRGEDHERREGRREAGRWEARRIVTSPDSLSKKNTHTHTHTHIESTEALPSAGTVALTAGVVNTPAALVD